MTGRCGPAAGGALLIGVAVPQFASCWLVLARSRRSAPGAALAGTVLVAWIVVQIVLLRRYFFLQPVIAVLGLAVVALAWSWLRSARPYLEAGPPANP